MCVSVSMFRIHVTFVIIINEAAPLISVSFGRRCAIVFLSPHFFLCIVPSFAQFSRVLQLLLLLLL